MEYWVCKADYDEQRKLVTKVVYFKKSKGVTIAAVYAKRDKLLDMIRHYKAFYRCIQTIPGKWKRKERIFYMVVNSGEYLRVDRKNIPADDLGDCPPTGLSEEMQNQNIEEPVLESRACLQAPACRRQTCR